MQRALGAKARLTYRNPPERHLLSNGGVAAARIDFDGRASRLEVGRVRESLLRLGQGGVEPTRASYLVIFHYQTLLFLPLTAHAGEASPFLSA